jgi:hypothetical protein
VTTCKIVIKRINNPNGVFSGITRHSIKTTKDLHGASLEVIKPGYKGTSQRAPLVCVGHNNEALKRTEISLAGVSRPKNYDATYIEALSVTPARGL